MNLLDSIGTNKDDLDSDIVDAIERAVGDFIERVHENIKNEDMVVSGKISDMKMQTEHGSVRVYANPWLVFQDMGVNGSKVKQYDTPYSYKEKMPPVQPFIDYIKDKNIRLRDNAKYGGEESPFKHLTEDEQIVQAAWAMAKSVFISGFKPRRIVSRELPMLREDLVKAIGESVASNLSVNFNLGKQTIEFKL